MSTRQSVFSLVFLSVLLLCQISIYAQCYNLVWEDEFSGTALDLTKWEYQVGGGGWGNSELQYYTAGDNVMLSGGTLKIIAEEDTGNVYPANDYTSSRIRTRYMGDWRYGKMEASIKLPVGQGIWPAFWMMPSYDVYGTWPSSGEIDIMEYLGHQLTTTYGTCHYGFSPSNKGSSGGSTTTVNPLSDAFHTFSVEWEPTQIRWYLDGVQFHVANITDPDFSTFNWPFDEHFHFILNIAVGGLWPGNPDGSTVFPQTMEVDWVRVYQTLSDMDIQGDALVEPGTSGVAYSLPDLPGAAYSWTLPAGATIAAGQNTHQILVDWGSTSGDVAASLTTACGVENYLFAVEVSPNLWSNYDFENGAAFWSTNLFNGANASFDLVNTDVQQGTTSMCVTTTGLTANQWDIQLGRSNVELTGSEAYTVSFWAKADQTGKDASLAIIKASNFGYITGQNFILTDSWAHYSFQFTAPNTETTLFNLDLGDEIGTFCFDNFLFARSVLLPIEYINFRAIVQENQSVLLRWETLLEDGLDHFEIEKSQDLKNWETVEKISAVGMPNQYEIIDERPYFGESFYRFKIYSSDGTTMLSEVIAVNIESAEILVYPNPFSQQIIVEGKDISHIEIYDAKTQLVKTMIIEEDMEKINIQTNDLPEGSYAIKVMTDRFLLATYLIKVQE